jgi:polysaccharide export outer membrane protein
LPDDLLLGPGDLLEISLYGIPDFKSEGRISARNQITLPMLGPVTVGGMTTDQAEKAIAAKLVAARLYNDPQVEISVKEYASEGISVLGEVQKPGIYQLLGARRLYDAISSAGGMTPKAGRYVLVTHRDDPDHTTKIPIAADAKSVQDNVQLRPGDTVVVSKAGLVYVVGDVHMAGGFVMENDKNITVLQAIALAQGIGPNPSLNAAKLIRTTPTGRQDVPLDLKKILTAKAPDIPLQADDIVFIPDNALRGGAKQSVQSIIQMATGIAIWRL